MSAVIFLPGVGPATHCEIPGAHSPIPLRFVWHHVYPHECGGPTTPENLAPVCDGCHYGIHALMWQMAQNGGNLTTLKRFAATARAKVAATGYQQALAAGTVNLIPNEGGVG